MLFFIIHFLFYKYHYLFFFFSFFFFNDTATTEIYTLSLHDALPISYPNSAQSLPRAALHQHLPPLDRKSTRLNSSHSQISYAVFCLKKKKKNNYIDWYLLNNVLGEKFTIRWIIN